MSSSWLIENSDVFVPKLHVTCIEELPDDWRILAESRIVHANWLVSCWRFWNTAFVSSLAQIHSVTRG